MKNYWLEKPEDGIIINEDVQRYGEHFILMHTPVIKDTLSCVILINDYASYCLSSNFLTEIMEGEFKIVAHRVDLVTGEIDIFWNKTPNKPVKLVASYEIVCTQ